MRKIIKFLLIIGWMILIFSFSNDSSTVSTKKSDSVIINIVEFVLDKDLNDIEREKWIDFLVTPVRKGAHFFVYFVLGIFLISFCSEFGIVSKKMVLLSLFLAFLYACSDEFHQSFIPGRSAQISDVLLDTFGSFTGIMIYKYIYHRIRGE